MKGREPRRRLRAVLFGLSVLCGVAASCAAPRVTERLYIGPMAREGREAGVCLMPFAVTSFDIGGAEEIRAIMDRKMAVALLSRAEITVREPGEDCRVALYPELIVKRYQQRYAERYYYLMSVSVRSAGELVGRYTYEYNGTSSIFDGRVQTSLIERFVDDFARRPGKT